MPLRVAIYARPDREEALELAREAYRRLESLGAQPYYDVSIAGLVGGQGIDLRFVDVEAVVAIGGDGTVLRLLQLLGERTPIIHLVRLGHRAFLFEPLDPESSLALLEKLVKGEYWVEELPRLKVVAQGFEGLALNEAAVLALGSKVAGLRVMVGEALVYRSLEGDGVIVATPSGSTAYNYSAGGPILHPSMNAVVITPVNPVNRTFGSIVVPGESEVVVFVERTTRPVKLIIDGVQERLLYRGAVVRLRLSGSPARIARYRQRPGWLRLPWPH
jgi:NAD+ kinase